MLTDKQMLFIWERDKNTLETKYKNSHPASYTEIVKDVAGLFPDHMDPSKIHCINDGDYQGTLLFLIPSNSYQPSNYYLVKISYGSCSYCDTLQRIRDDGDSDDPNESQAKDYFTLALHVFQSMKEI